MCTVYAGVYTSKVISSLCVSVCNANNGAKQVLKQLLNKHR